MGFKKKSSSGGSGAKGSTSKDCKQEGTLVVIANLVAEATQPFKDGLDVKVTPGGHSGKTGANGAKEFPKLVTNTYAATVSLGGGLVGKFELLGNNKKSASIPAGSTVPLNFDVTPLHTLRVKVKVKGSSPPVFLKPEKITLKEAKGKVETSSTPDGTWEFKKLHPGRPKVEVKLATADAEKYELVQKVTEHPLTTTPSPNVLEIEVQRLPVTVPLHFIFKFLDPEAKPRILAGPLSVKIKLSELVPPKAGDPPAGPDILDGQINVNGVLVAPNSTDRVRASRAYKKITLDLTQIDAQFLICEAAGATAPSAATVTYEDTDAFRAKLRAGRALMLPWKREWTLDTADWDIKDGTADAKPRLGQLNQETMLFGTVAQGMVFTLKPRWQFARITYFDRYFGFNHHAKAPVAIPPVILRGYRVIPGKAKVVEAETAAAEAATKAADLATKRDALHLAQDELDAIDNDVAFKRYLKNWHDANRPVGDADRVKANSDFTAAMVPRTAAATTVTNAQNAFNPAQTAANTAATAATTKLAAAREEWKKVMADTCSSWIHLPGGDAKAAIQCLPWILNKKPDGSADTTLDTDVVLEFKSAKDSFIESTSETARAIVKVVAGDKRLDPGPERLKIYDLPTVWRSRRYFARLGAKANRFEQLAGKPTSLTEPITFCLDDLVLCQREHSIGTEIKLRVMSDKEWAPDKRCTLFHHRFRSTAADGSALADISKQGVFKADTAANKSYFSLVPTGTAAGTAGDTTVEKDRNYIAEYPHWTRLVLALGNAFDVFDRRTPDNPIAVTGARAAVCWRDVTAEMTGVEMEQSRFIETTPGNGDWGTAAAANHRPSPTKSFKNRPSAWAGGRYFHLQPYVEAEYHSFRNDKFDPSRSFGIGRVDYVLLRCCGRLGDGATAKEHAVNLHFTRNFFQFTPSAGTALASTGLAEEAWKDAWIKNCISRWNGDDPGKNIHRGRLIPADLPDGTKASLAMECDVLWFMHVTDRLRAQFLVNVEDRGASARDNRGGTTGTGESSPAGYQDTAGQGEDFSGASVATGWYPSAHESGHADALPDEYNERWDGASHGQMSYKSNLPGDPFEPDGRMVSWATNGSPMMNGNQLLRNRYFWVSAEWVRHRLEAGVRKIPFKVVFTSPTGTAYDKFQLPPHPSEQRTYLYWPIRAAIDNSVATIRGQRNFYLYPLGQEEWTVRDIYARQNPTAGPDAANPYDGICIVTINLETLLPSWPLGAGSPNAATTETNRQKILRAITGVVLSNFNFKWYLTGKVIEGAAEWTFKRCLIFFSLRYLDGRDAAADGLRTKFGSQFVLDASHAIPASSSWHAAVGSADSHHYDLKMSFVNAAYPNTVAREVRDIFPTMLGINKAWDAIGTADLQKLLGPLNVQALLIHAV